MARYQVAERLHKTLAEVSEMSEDEFIHWLAFWKMKEKTTDGN